MLSDGASEEHAGCVIPRGVGPLGGSPGNGDGSTGEHTAYREITVIEIKEVLRLWLWNRSEPSPMSETVGADPKAVRGFIQAARAVVGT